MAKLSYVAFTSPVAGREEEFHDWYVNRHLDDLMGVPHVSSAKLFKLGDQQRLDPPYPWQYMALYEIDTDDVPGFLEAMAERRGTADMPLCEALSPVKSSYFLTPVAARP